MSWKAEVPGQCAKFGWPFYSALDVDSFNSVAFFDIVNILEEVQVQVKAIRSLHGVGQLFSLNTRLTALGLDTIGTFLVHNGWESVQSLICVYHSWSRQPNLIIIGRLFLVHQSTKAHTSPNTLRWFTTETPGIIVFAAA